VHVAADLYSVVVETLTSIVLVTGEKIHQNEEARFGGRPCGVSCVCFVR
jgi:hypothetical protein